MKSKINWTKGVDNEWLYVGDKVNFQGNQVQELIDLYFEESELYFVINRHNAYSISKEQASDELQKKAMKQDAIICNTSFTKND